jgi:glycosyltransferase involved in cell wall biosynthesis
MRYAWTFYDEYFGTVPMNNLVCKPLLGALRRWDRRTAGNVDRFVAISRHVAARIREFYGRESDIVNPPVDTGFFTPGREVRAEFDLIVSALVPYKRIELAVSAYTRTGRALKIVGVGTELPRLRRMAGPTIEFLGWLTDEEIRTLYRTCRCLVFPGEEDFGIVPLEAQSCGCPVVAYGKGGALETVRDGISGVFFETQAEESLLEAVDRCSAARWDPAAIRAQAGPFGIQEFVDGIAGAIERCMG